MPTAPCARQCSTLRQGEEVPESLLARATACFGKGWYTDCLHSSEPACHPQNFQSLVTLHSLQPSWCQLWAIAFSVPANFTSLKPNSRCHLSYNKSHRVPLPLRIFRVAPTALSIAQPPPAHGLQLLEHAQLLPASCSLRLAFI